MWKDWEWQLQGLPWAGSDKTINIEVNDPNSIESLLKIILVYLCVHTVSIPTSYVPTLCAADPPSASSHSYFSPLSVFSLLHSLRHRWCSLAVLPVGSLHVMQCARQAQQERLQCGKFRHFHNGVFSFYLAAQFPRASWTYTAELGTMRAHGKHYERMAHAVHDGWRWLFILTELQKFKHFSWIFIWNWRLFNLALTFVW